MVGRLNPYHAFVVFQWKVFTLIDSSPSGCCKGLLRQLYNITLYRMCCESHLLSITHRQVRANGAYNMLRPLSLRIATKKFVNRSEAKRFPPHCPPSFHRFSIFASALRRCLAFFGCAIKLYLNAHIEQKTLITFIIPAMGSEQLSDLAEIEKHLMGFSLGFVCINAGSWEPGVIALCSYPIERHLAKQNSISGAIFRILIKLKSKL